MVHVYGVIRSLALYGGVTVVGGDCCVAVGCVFAYVWREQRQGVSEGRGWAGGMAWPRRGDLEVSLVVMYLGFPLQGACVWWCPGVAATVVVVAGGAPIGGAFGILFLPDPLCPRGAW